MRTNSIFYITSCLCICLLAQHLPQPQRRIEIQKQWNSIGFSGISSPTFALPTSSSRAQWILYKESCCWVCVCVYSWLSAVGVLFVYTDAFTPNSVLILDSSTHTAVVVVVVCCWNWLLTREAAATKFNIQQKANAYSVYCNKRAAGESRAGDEKRRREKKYSKLVWAVL